MRQNISLIAAPPGLSPGGYVAKAYAGRIQAMTRNARVEVKRQGEAWHIELDWPCAEPVTSLADDVDRFVDAAAVLTSSRSDTSWMTMGDTGDAVTGVLWRADQEALTGIHAEGLGTVERLPAPDGVRVAADWKNGHWVLQLDFDAWAQLDNQRQIAIAVWQGADKDRGGLKSVSPDWISVAA